MARTFVKGNKVANASSYELLERMADGSYRLIDTASDINFEVSALGLDAGAHTFVVQAEADGYKSSDHSNMVTYIVIGEGGNSGGSTEPDNPDSGGDVTPTTTWYIDHANQLIDNNVDIASGNGLGITVGAFAYEDSVNAALIGKPINTVQYFAHTEGEFTFYKWNKSTDTLTEIESITLSNVGSTLQTHTFNNEFTLEDGEYFAFGNTTDTGKTYYYYNINFGSAYNGKPYYNCGHGGTVLGSLCNLGINIGYVA